MSATSDNKVPLWKYNKDNITPINKREDQLSIYRQQTRFFCGPTECGSQLGAQVYGWELVAATPLPSHYSGFKWHLQSKMALLISGIFWLHFSTMGGSGNPALFFFIYVNGLTQLVTLTILICAAANVLLFSQQANSLVSTPARVLP